MAHLNWRQAALDYSGRMAATVVEAAAADHLLTEEVALVDRPERGKLALTGAQA